MASEWVKLTNETGECIYVNLANANWILYDNKRRIGNLVSCGRGQRREGSCQGASRKGSYAV